MPSRADDPALKVGFADNHFVMAPGGGGTAEVTADVIYLTMSVRNVGSGIAVLDGWRVDPERQLDRIAQLGRPPLESFRRLSRDIYIASGDVGFWQGAFRDPSEPEFADVGGRIAAPERILIDLLYGDHQGSQRIVSRFSCRRVATAAGLRPLRSTGTSTAPTLADDVRACCQRRLGVVGAGVDLLAKHRQSCLPSEAISITVRREMGSSRRNASPH